jgi:hypothetical protein
MNDGVTALPTLAWLPLTFVLWVVPPVIAVAMLAGKSRANIGDAPHKISAAHA